MLYPDESEQRNRRMKQFVLNSENIKPRITDVCLPYISDLLVK